MAADAILIYQFNESPGSKFAVDQSINGIDGELNNIFENGSAYQFDGANSNVQVVNDSGLFNFNSSDNFTFTAWLMFDGMTGGRDVIFSRRTSAGYILQIFSGNRLDFFLDNGTSSSNCLLSTNMENNSYRFVAFIYNGSRNIMVNGTKLRSCGGVDGFQQSGINLVIGEDNFGNVNFDGYMKEIRVFDRRLKDDELLFLMENTTPPTYMTGGTYTTIVHNASDQGPDLKTYKWHHIKFYDGQPNNVDYRTDSCLDVDSADWLPAVYNGTVWKFTAGSINGECMQARLNFTTDRISSAQIQNYTYELSGLEFAAPICDDDNQEPNQLCSIYLSSNCSTIILYNRTDQIDTIVADPYDQITNFVEYNFTEEGEYRVVSPQCEGVIKQIIVKEDEEMAGDAGFAITLFVLTVTFGLFYFGVRKEEIVKNQFLNVVIKRSLITVGIYLMMLNSAMVATIARDAGLTLTSEMLQYTWLFGTAGSIAMVYVMVKTLFDVLAMYKMKKYNDRMGENDEK